MPPFHSKHGSLLCSSRARRSGQKALGRRDNVLNHLLEERLERLPPLRFRQRLILEQGLLEEIRLQFSMLQAQRAYLERQNFLCSKEQRAATKEHVQHGENARPRHPAASAGDRIEHGAGLLHTSPPPQLYIYRFMSTFSEFIIWRRNDKFHRSQGSQKQHASTCVAG